MNKWSKLQQKIKTFGIRINSISSIKPKEKPCELMSSQTPGIEPRMYFQMRNKCTA